MTSMLRHSMLRLSILISLMVSILIHFPEVVSLFDLTEGQELFPGMRPVQVVNEVTFTWVALMIMFGMNVWLLQLNQTIAKIASWRWLLAIALTWTLSHFMSQGFVYLHHVFNIPAIDSMVHHYLHPLRDFIIAATVCGTCYISYLFRRQQQTMIENEQLQAENILNQYEVLKNQLNPHMLFNSLNTLRYLVADNQKRAQQYIGQLSAVLRYTLQSNEHRSVTLAEEMEFVKSYNFLLTMRYEENLSFDIQIEPKCLDLFLPPMAVQMLIENAVKHNEISRRHPLCILIRTTDHNQIIIANDIQPKLTESTGTGVGLANLAKRYMLLYKKDILITQDSRFTATLPLFTEEQAQFSQE